MTRLIAVVALAIPAHAHAASVTFSVTVPDNTPEGDTVYIAGGFQGWNPGDPAYALTEQPGGTWEITLSLTDGVGIQFKFTRGSWAVVEKGPSGEEIGNRTHLPSGTETLDLVVATWADGQASTITGNVESFQFAPFLNGRRCWVYLPPDYETNTQRTYPVLYMHDGQNIFDDATSFAGEWQVDEACEALIASGEIEPVIVVGIENGGGQRCFEYVPWNVIGCGGGGDAYLTAVRDVLIPEVNQRYRTKPGPEHTLLAGSSLGGVISLYGAYVFSDTFGRVAGVSASYWVSNELFNLAAAVRPENLDLLYIDMGTAEGGFPDSNNNGVNDNVDLLRVMRDTAAANGFELGNDLMSVEGQGHEHNEFYWAQRMPDILRFLLAPIPCVGDANGDGVIDFGDVTGVLGNWLNDYSPGTGPGDADANGLVNFGDVTAVLGSWLGVCDD